MRSPNTNMTSALVPESLVPRIVGMCTFFGSFHSTWYIIEAKLFLGVFRSPNTNMTSALVPESLVPRMVGMCTFFGSFHSTWYIIEA